MRFYNLSLFAFAMCVVAPACSTTTAPEPVKARKALKVSGPRTPRQR